jgi:hypothetical protein
LYKSMASPELTALSIANSPQETAIPTSVGMETATQTANRARQMLEPSVSADQLVEGATPVTPPVPAVNTNDGSRTANLVSTTATGTQNFITSQSENAKQRDEIAQLLGSQEFDAAGFRQGLNEQFGMSDTLGRLTDIQTQLAQANTASGVTREQIRGASGQTIAQAQREVTQEDRENAVRTAGLAAEAQILQGNIQTASTLINSAMQDFYADRQLANQNMIQQLDYYSGLADDETAQLLRQEQRKYEEDQSNISRAQSLVDSAVASGYLAGEDLQSVLGINDPVAQAEQAQMIIANGIRRDIEAAKASAASGGFDTPDVKNFGTADSPLWKQWNASLGVWEDVDGVIQQGGEDPGQSLDQLSFLRNSVNRILGEKDPETGEQYDALYEASGTSGIARFVGDKFVGDTDYRRLEAYADTLKTHVLALMTDPTIRKFFGPQMSNADVRLMSSAGTSLRTDSLSPEDLKAEVIRLDDLFNRMETAVKMGVEQGSVNQTIAPKTNIITAPDGTRIEIVD